MDGSFPGTTLRQYTPISIDTLGKDFDSNQTESILSDCSRAELQDIKSILEWTS